jgi:hypothetical protein
MSWRDITEESIDHVLAVDVKGTLLCTQELGSRMLDAGGGAIINIGSTVVVRGSARAPQYAAAKYGILGITKSYAAAFAPTVRHQPSMLQDVLARGPTEIDVLNGGIVQGARETGVPVPSTRPSRPWSTPGALLGLSPDP